MVHRMEPLRSAIVFVIVLNWNLADETVACVESLLIDKRLQQQIIIVDNGSTDGSAEALRGRWGKGVDLISLESNEGFAKGMNQGAQHALARGADWVLLLNNDTVAAPDMLQHLLAAAQEHPEWAILSPAIYYYDQPNEVWRLGDRRWPWLPLPLQVPHRRAQKKVPFEVDYVPGCAMLIRRDLFEEIGFLDESIFMYYEDADFCRRARDAGYKVGVAPEAKLWHRVSRSSEKVQVQSTYRRMKGKVAFMRRYRHGPLPMLTDLYLMLDLVKEITRLLLYGDWALLGPTWRGFRMGWRV